MSAPALTALIARCRLLCRPPSPLSDAALLRCFTDDGDTAAFEELLQRHAVLVWGVCRRILGNEADCEDAFQATFLALVRRAGVVEARPSLAAWLHTVAVRVARKAQARSRRQHPQAVVPERTTSGDVADEVSNRELLRLVDEEIERLPAAVRAPLILCCLQGRTRDEAAEALGCSVAAVKGRLERGRALLRRRLTQRGVQLPAAFLVLGLTSERIGAGLWAKTLQSVRYTPAPTIAALAEAALPSLLLAKGKLVLALLLLAMSTTGLLGSVLIGSPRQMPDAPPQAKAAEPKQREAPHVRRDRHGDPLPDGAIARLGTVRLRHGFFVYALAYSPDGKRIAAVGAGRAITLWDSATGKEIHQLPNDNQPQTVAFSPDGRVLATASNTPICRLWDVASGKELRQLKGHKNGSLRIAFSPDGKSVATASADGTLRLWNPATGTEQRRIDCGQGELYTTAFCSDGKLLASAGKDGTIRLWDPATGTERHRMTGHKKEIGAVVFSPNDKLLASASSDETVRLWDTATGRQVRVLVEKRGGYWSPIAFSPDGALLAGGDAQGFIHLWDIATATEVRHWRAGAMVVKAIAFAPDGKTLASGTVWESIRLWDVATGRERHPSDEHHGFVDLVRFSPDGRTLTSIGRDRCLLRWDLATNTPQQQFSWTTKNFGMFTLSPDGNTLAGNGWPDSHLRLWDVHTGKPRRALGKPREGTFWAIAFSADGRLVASESDDHAIHIWDVRDGKEIQQIKNVNLTVRNLRFSPDSKALACGLWSEGKLEVEPTLRLWDVSSGKELTHFDSHVSIDGSLAFSPDGKVLASAADRDTNMVRLWDTATGKELCRHMGHQEPIGAIAFSPDGKLVASGAGNFGRKDNSVHVWEAATGQLIRRFEGHHSCIGSVDFSPDGLMVASGAGDSTILLWDITGRRVDGRWHAKPMTPRQLDACWMALANEDAAKAYDAVWALVAAPEQALPLLKKQLSPVPRPDAKAVARLIADLDSQEFAVREKATEELSKLGDAAAPALRQALQGKPSLEMRRRLQQLLDQSRDWTGERLRAYRAIQVLEHIGTRQAKDVLQALAEGAEGVYRTEAAREALQRLRR